MKSPGECTPLAVRPPSARNEAPHGLAGEVEAERRRAFEEDDQPWWRIALISGGRRSRRDHYRASPRVRRAVALDDRLGAHACLRGPGAWAGRAARGAGGPCTRTTSTRSGTRWASGLQSRDVDFWRRHLEDLPDALTWSSIADARQDPDGVLSAHRVELPPDLVSPIRLACRRHGVTPFMWLLAVLDISVYSVPAAPMWSCARRQRDDSIPISSTWSASCVSPRLPDAARRLPHVRRCPDARPSDRAGCTRTTRFRSRRSSMWCAIGGAAARRP